MIKRSILIDSLNLRYHVGIGKIKIDYNDFLNSHNLNDKKSTLDLFFYELESLEKLFVGSTIQFIKDEYLINEEHLFLACYHVQKAFTYQTNISNKKSLELLLYLSTNRQIKNGIRAFGIDSQELLTKSLTFCIISPIDNLLEIKNTILKKFNGVEVDFELFIQEVNKYNKIMEFFQINEDQVNVIINSHEELGDKEKIQLKCKFNALYELTCEKMVLLSLEKIKLDHA